MSFPVMSVISEAIGIIRNRPVVLLPALISWLISMPYYYYFYSIPDMENYPLSMALILAGQIVAANIAIFLIDIFLGGAQIHAAYNSGSKGFSIGKSFRASFSAYLYLVASAIVVAVAVLAGLIALIIPGIYIALRLSFVAYGVVVDRLGPIEAMEKSWKIAKGSIISMLLLTVAVYAPLIALSIILGATGYLAGIAYIDFYYNAAIALIAAVFTTVYTVSFAIVYKKLR